MSAKENKANEKDSLQNVEENKTDDNASLQNVDNQATSIKLMPTTNLKHSKNTFLNSIKYAEYKHIIFEKLKDNKKYTEKEVIEIITDNYS